MPQIFVSYSHKDRNFAHRLVNNLSLCGADIWIDTEKIRGGEIWLKEIDEALKACQIMLLVISPNSMASENVNAELRYFVESRKRLIPIRWRPADVPFVIQQLHYIDFRSPYNLAFLQLHTVLNEYGCDLKPIPPSIAELDIVFEQEPLPLHFEDMIQIARHQIWVSGIALDTLINAHLDDLCEALQHGICARFMTVGLEEQALNQTGAWLGNHPGAAKGSQTSKNSKKHRKWLLKHFSNLTPEGIEIGIRVRRNLLKLGKCLEAYPEEQAEIRVLRGCRPSSGYLIVDPGKKHGQMKLAPYFYLQDKISIAPPGKHRRATLIHLSESSPDEAERGLFKLYVDDFERLWWNEADPFNYKAIQ
jgi:hypothetical protein